ncbi:NAD(P)H-hydrate dehydratase [Algoriphagus namhaensis]|uniref:Bifunctional NAD(P)H-hydrate repair enzyme n=1 Tax=Algoriphagus namhaensis TaxID=915353 RepID=A0ABV8ARE3_9BACT
MMIKIVKGDQIKALDRLHLSLSGQSSIELMERAAQSFCDWFIPNHAQTEVVSIWCGAGNNGGDGFAIARILSRKGFTVEVKCCFENSTKLSDDAQRNFERLPEIIRVRPLDDHVNKSTVLIDAFLGVGFRGALKESAVEIIEKMNRHSAKKISVDIPSGLPSEELPSGAVFLADVTVSFAQPKLSLLLPENEAVVGELVVLDIGVFLEVYEGFDTDFYYITRKDIPEKHHRFGRFSHKGDFGKVMLMGGSLGKMGAILLTGKSALRTGSGLLQLNIDKDQNLIAQVGLTEAMTTVDEKPDLSGIDALGIGPGWGTENRLEKLEYVLENFSRGIVLDADALNLISKNEKLLLKLPANTILTPHLKEFDRLVGSSENQLERWQKAKELAMELRIIIVLKGANTLINLPDGRQLFNSTGNHYMATAGSGDVLTGMITSFLGQGYSPENAAICGVYHHGLAGEIASKSKRRGLIAGDLIQTIPDTYIELGIK